MSIRQLEKWFVPLLWLFLALVLGLMICGSCWLLVTTDSVKKELDIVANHTVNLNEMGNTKTDWDKAWDILDKRTVLTRSLGFIKTRIGSYQSKFDDYSQWMMAYAGKAEMTKELAILIDQQNSFPIYMNTQEGLDTLVKDYHGKLYEIKDLYPTNINQRMVTIAISPLQKVLVLYYYGFDREAGEDRFTTVFYDRLADKVIIGVDGYCEVPSWSDDEAFAILRKDADFLLLDLKKGATELLNWEDQITLDNVFFDWTDDNSRLITSSYFGTIQIYDFVTHKLTTPKVNGIEPLWLENNQDFICTAYSENWDGSKRNLLLEVANGDGFDESVIVNLGQVYRYNWVDKYHRLVGVREQWNEESQLYVEKIYEIDIDKGTLTQVDEWSDIGIEADIAAYRGVLVNDTDVLRNHSYNVFGYQYINQVAVADKESTRNVPLVRSGEYIYFQESKDHQSFMIVDNQVVVYLEKSDMLQLVEESQKD